MNDKLKAYNKNFRMNLQELIDSYGMNQGEFARKVKIPQGTISNILAGRHKPGADLLLKIALSTGVSLDRLFGLRD